MRPLTPQHWFTLFWLTALLAPPIPVPFTETRSVFSLAIFVGLAYIAVFLAKHLYAGQIVLPNGKIWAHALAYTIILYLLIHGFFWFAILDSITVLFTEWQWAFYFLVTLLLISEMRKGESLLIYFKKLFIWTLSLEALLGIITSLIGPLPLYEYAAGYYSGRFSADFYRALGTQTSANVLAGLLAFGALLAVLNPKVFSAPIRFLQASILLIGLLATQSKSGVLAFLLGLLTAKGMQIILDRELSYKTISSLLLLISLLAYTFSYNSNFFLNLYSTDYVERAHTTAQTLQKYFNEYSMNEQIFGVGFRQSAFVSEYSQAWSTAHNSYVSLLAEIGLVGLLIVGTILFWTFCLLIDSQRWDFLAGSIALTAHFMTEGFIYGHVYVIILACLLVTPVFAAKRETSRNNQVTKALPNLADVKPRNSGI